MATNGGNGTRATGPRCVALVGPFQSGKTTLLEAILARTGAIPRQGTVEAGNTVGDASKEARHHRMSVELSVATTSFMGDSYTFLDCPGSVEFVHDMRAVLPAIDAAVVVCEMDEKKVPQLQLILRELEDKKIPRILFVNKIDKADAGVHDVLKLLQPASRTKLIMRQIPTFSGDLISGFVDLALERAFVYKEHAPSEVVPLEGDAADLEKTARFSMLETLADHDDELMEQLLEDIQPPRDKVFDDLTRELREGLVCPVLMGTATRANGVLRLLKALRHESPGIAETAKRLGVKSGSDAVAYVLKTHEHHPRRQNVDRAGARRPGRRRHDIARGRRRGRPRRRRVQARRSDHREARRGRGRRDRRASPSSTRPRPATRLTAGKQAHPALANVEPYPPVLAIAHLGEGAQGRRQARPGAAQARRGRSLDHHRAQSGDPRGGAVGPGRDASARRHRAAQRSLRRPDRAAPAQRRLSRDHPQRRRPARPPQEAVGRPRPVRRRRARHQADAARRGLLLRGKNHRRRVPRNYIPSVEEGVVDALQARAARLSRGRPCGGAGRRLVSHGRFLRHGVPHRRPRRHRRGAAAVPAGAARADPSGRDRLSRPKPPRRSTR